MKTVSLELAKELKEAGYPQDGDMYYWHANIGNQYYLRRMTRTMNEYSKERDYSSPTADEILDQLPWQVKDGMDRGRLVVEKSFFDKKWKVTYVDYSGGRFAQSNQDENIANSAAKMWLYLKKEKLI